MPLPQLTERLHTPVCDLFGCDYPIVLAGMGGVARSELVTAVINAGAYGFLGMVREPPDRIRAEIKQVREKSNREFGVNIIPAATRPELLASQIQVCMEEQVASVCLFWDIYPALIKQLREANILVVHQIGSEQDARQAQAAGAQVLIAQGVEAGGHVRGKLPLRELLPRVLRISDVPVLAAGGITNGEDLAEILRSGAQGVVMGTAFLATAESYAHDYHKQRILAAGKDEPLLTTLFHINWLPGATTRVLPNSATQADIQGPDVNEGDLHAIGEDEGRPIYLYSTDSPLKSTTGNLEAMALYAGAGAYRIKKMEPAAVKIRNMIEAFEARPGPDNGHRHSMHDNPRFYSAPCFAAEADRAYMGLANNDEIVGFLEDLLSTERILARIAIRSCLECPGTGHRNFFRMLHSSSVRWSHLLTDWIKNYYRRPVIKTGSVPVQSIWNGNIESRIAYIDREQTRVIEEAKKIMARIDVVQLLEDLRDILTCHTATNIIARKLLETVSRFDSV